MFEACRRGSREILRKRRSDNAQSADRALGDARNDALRSRERRNGLDASDGDRVIALMLSYNVAGAPIVKTAIRKALMALFVDMARVR
jgi:hypothetical protein